MTMAKPTLDLALAHAHFSADCFNRTWTLIEKSGRSAADDEAMVLMALASLWHWTQRADGTRQNLSIGHWQVSRVYALVGQGDNAMRHAQRCLEEAAGSPPFFVGYAHEAMARAAWVQRDPARFKQHMGEAQALLAKVDEAEDRKLLEADLQQLAQLAGT